MADGNLYEDQHAGGGPTLTSSGLDLTDGTVGAAPDGGNVLAGGAYDDLGNFTGAVDTNAVDGMSVVKATFDKIINWRLRFEPMYQKFATVRPVREAAYPGSKVTLFRTGAKGLPLAKTPLSEYADPDAVALPGLEDSLDVTVNEYGNATVVTQRLKRFSWTTIDPMQAEYVARNMKDTVDATYMDTIYGLEGGWLGKGFRQALCVDKGTNEAGIALTGGTYDDIMFENANGPLGDGGADAGEAAAGGKLTASAVRRIVAHFRSLGVRPMADGYYVGLVTPEVALQLREDSGTEGANGWRYPHLDGSWNGNILNGTIGVFEGVRFIEGPQFKGLDKGGVVDPDTNNILNVAPTSGNTHNCLFIGAEGIADVTVEAPHTVVTPTTDRFGRLAGLGWIGTWGTSVYDNNAGLLVSVDVQ
jgi:N4-gp56 family major capsid protein